MQVAGVFYYDHVRTWEGLPYRWQALLLFAHIGRASDTAAHARYGREVPTYVRARGGARVPCTQYRAAETSAAYSSCYLVSVGCKLRCVHCVECGKTAGPDLRPVRATSTYSHVICIVRTARVVQRWTCLHATTLDTHLSSINALIKSQE